jgi:hypothetical protein
MNFSIVYQPSLAAYERSPETGLRNAYQREHRFAGKHAFGQGSSTSFANNQQQMDAFN